MSQSAELGRDCDRVDGLTRIQRSESSRELRAWARHFRRAPTAAEARLWQALRDRRFRGLKFRRQRPAGPFIADFYCADLNLVIEVDGAIHDLPEVVQHDHLRDEWLQTRRLRVLRLPSALILHDLTTALRLIAQTVDEIQTSSKPPPGHEAQRRAEAPLSRGDGRGEPR